MEMPAEEFRNHLLAFKHKMKNVVWTKVDTCHLCCSTSPFHPPGHLRPRGRVPVRLRGGLLHRQEHDPHRRHQGRSQVTEAFWAGIESANSPSQVRRLLHPADPQVRRAEPRPEEDPALKTQNLLEEEGRENSHEETSRLYVTVLTVYGMNKASLTCLPTPCR